MSESNKPRSPAEKVGQIKEDCDDYKHTVWAILAFAHHARWDDKKKEIIASSRYSLGRRMTIGSAEPDVTPDLVVQRSSTYGLVCEAKKSLPRDTQRWQKIVRQLEKYDRITEGWFSAKSVSVFDVVLLTDMSRSVAFSDFLEASGTKFDNPHAVIGFEHTSETTLDDLVTLKKERGCLSDPFLEQSLHFVTKVPLKKIYKGTAQKKFYDSKPPLAYLVFIMWNHIFANKIIADVWDTERKAFVLRVNARRVTEELQEYFGQRSDGEREREIPQMKWVNEALEFLVSAKYAAKGAANGEFLIIWKRIRGDILERFAKLSIEFEKIRARKPFEETDFLDELL